MPSSNLEDLTEDSVIIAVMGPTGSGKSSFIDTAERNQTVIGQAAEGFQERAGHTLVSCTTEISLVKVPIPSSAEIFLVDTPGFDDTNKQDTEILTMISDWLNTTYRNNIKLSGILYFHRISDNRMSGTPLKNLRMFEKLVGRDFHNIILTTTMWDEVEEQDGLKREEELKSQYWKPMIDRGSRTARFLRTGPSAFEILGPLINEANRREALLLQKEVTEFGLKLPETSAGRRLFTELEGMMEMHQKIHESILEALKSGNEGEVQRLTEEYKTITSKLSTQAILTQLEELKIDGGARLRGMLKRVTRWDRIKRRLISLKNPGSEPNENLTGGVSPPGSPPSGQSGEQPGDKSNSELVAIISRLAAQVEFQGRALASVETMLTEMRSKLPQ